MLARRANYKQQKESVYFSLLVPFLSNICITGTTTLSHYTGGTKMLFASKLVDLAYNKLPAR